MSMPTTALFELLKPTRRTSIVDIGANGVDGPPPYKEMLAAGICDVTGFEPQDRARAELDRRKSKNERYLPDAIGDGAEHDLHITIAEGMTSLLKPDQANLSLFTDFERFGTVTRKERISTRRLDDIQEIDVIDLLKIDIQGGEFAAITNGTTKLAETVAIQIEVSFIPLYEGQPVFAQTDLMLRQMGFIPHCFAELKKWPLAPFRSFEPQQLLEADVLYVRDFRRPANLKGEQWKHLALIAHHCYRSFDLAMLAIRSAAEIGAAGHDLPRAYSELLGRMPKKRK